MIPPGTGAGTGARRTRTEGRSGSPPASRWPASAPSRGAARRCRRPPRTRVRGGSPPGCRPRAASWRWPAAGPRVHTAHPRVVRPRWRSAARVRCCSGRGSAPGISPAAAIICGTAGSGAAPGCMSLPPLCRSRAGRPRRRRRPSPCALRLLVVRGSRRPQTLRSYPGIFMPEALEPGESCSATTCLKCFSRRPSACGGCPARRPWCPAARPPRADHASAPCWARRWRPRQRRGVRSAAAAPCRIQSPESRTPRCRTNFFSGCRWDRPHAVQARGVQVRHRRAACAGSGRPSPRGWPGRPGRRCRRTALPRS